MNVEKKISLITAQSDSKRQGRTGKVISQNDKKKSSTDVKANNVYFRAEGTKKLSGITKNYVIYRQIMIYGVSA